MRLFYPGGSLVPTKDECTEKERQAKEVAELRANAAEIELARLRARNANDQGDDPN